MRTRTATAINGVLALIVIVPSWWVAPARAQDFVGDLGAAFSATPPRPFEPTVRSAAAMPSGEIRAMMEPDGTSLDIEQKNFCGIRRIATTATLQPSVTVSESKTTPAISMAYTNNITHRTYAQVTGQYAWSDVEDSGRDPNSGGGELKVGGFLTDNRAGAQRTCADKCLAEQNRSYQKQYEDCIKRQSCAPESTCDDDCQTAPLKAAAEFIGACATEILAGPGSQLALALVGSSTYTEYSGTRGATALAVSKTVDWLGTPLTFTANAGWTFSRPEANSPNADAFLSSFAAEYVFTSTLAATISYTLDNDVSGNDAFSALLLYDLTPNWFDGRITLLAGYQKSDTFLGRIRVSPNLSYEDYVPGMSK